MRKTSQSGLLSEWRVDSKIFFSKQFVGVWRGATALEKIQFIDFVSGKEKTLPPRFCGVYQPLSDIHCSDAYDFFNSVRMLGARSKECRELAQNWSLFNKSIQLKSA